jgi:KTSC domain-containing protein
MKVPRTPVLLILAILAVGTAHAAPGDAVRSRIKRATVSSSNVASIGYSRHLRALEIEFTRGAIYRFLEVPPGIYRGLLAADSKGHYIAENIRGKYHFVRVRASRTDPAARPDL